MKLLLAIQFVLLNVAGSFADMVELSREGLPSPHHRRSQVRPLVACCLLLLLLLFENEYL